MTLSKVLSLALAVTAVRAIPITNPSRVVPRQAAPTPFPLGNACVNEWQYVNFDTADATDSAHLQKLHDIVCSGEMRAGSSYGALSAENTLAPYLRYFAASDEEDDT